MFVSPNFLLVHCGVSLFCVSSSFHLLLHAKFGFFQHLLCLQWVSSLGEGQGGPAHEATIFCFPSSPTHLPPSTPQSSQLTFVACRLLSSSLWTAMRLSEMAIRRLISSSESCVVKRCCSSFTAILTSFSWTWYSGEVKQRRLEG